MERRNVVFTKDGVRVGIRHVNTEKYVDQTQNWVVKAWSLATGKVNDEYVFLFNNTLSLRFPIFRPSCPCIFPLYIVTKWLGKTVVLIFFDVLQVGSEKMTTLPLQRTR